MVKSPPPKAGDVRDSGSTPDEGRSPGGGHRRPLQYSCLENPTDSSVGCSPQVRRESDTTEVIYHTRAHIPILSQILFPYRLLNTVSYAIQ